ncbi:hypothetical protein, partial [Shouchella clausii]|uniref:hypothetical protein n=1 Tax=Shouchella clausii TaxID=79880 RepID=UPI001C7362C4
SEENGGPCPPSFTEIPIYPNKGESRSSQISTPLLHFKGFWDNLFQIVDKRSVSHSTLLPRSFAHSQLHSVSRLDGQALPV